MVKLAKILKVMEDRVTPVTEDRKGTGSTHSIVNNSYLAGTKKPTIADLLCFCEIDQLRWALK